MPQNDEKPNKNAISAPKVPNEFFKKIINGHLRISHFEICRLFGLNPVDTTKIIDAFRAEDGQHDTVVLVGTLRWLDATAFYALSCELNLPEYLSQAVLAALGHFLKMEDAA